MLVHSTWCKRIRQMQASDDEFEEFEVMYDETLITRFLDILICDAIDRPFVQEENWPLAKKEDSSLWNTDWDTDEVTILVLVSVCLFRKILNVLWMQIDPIFAEKLRRKLEESAATAAASAPSAQNGQEE